ncbi:MAG: hypothetical protein J6T70_08900 [Bacteroidales bacterium]|nr:hypothetical protein [Bacteroidales bacterium]
MTQKNGFNHTNEQEHKDICSAMIGFMDSGKPQVGIFWYDAKTQSLFDYTMIPRGRIFLDEQSGKYQVYVEHWVEDLPDVKHFKK